MLVNKFIKSLKYEYNYQDIEDEFAPFMLTIIFIPFALIVDMVVLPFELLYWSMGRIKK